MLINNTYDPDSIARATTPSDLWHGEFEEKPIFTVFLRRKKKTQKHDISVVSSDGTKFRDYHPEEWPDRDLFLTAQNLAPVSWWASNEQGTLQICHAISMPSRDDLRIAQRICGRQSVFHWQSTSPEDWDTTLRMVDLGALDRGYLRATEYEPIKGHSGDSRSAVFLRKEDYLPIMHTLTYGNI